MLVLLAGAAGAGFVAADLAPAQGVVRLVLRLRAIAVAGDPSLMAAAFALAVQAGRSARLAGIMSQSEEAVPTSPLTSFLADAGALPKTNQPKV